MLDILITHGYILTMTGEGVGLIPDGAIGIQGNEIAVIGPSLEVSKSWQAHRYIDARNKAVLPGLIDAHIHTGIACMRGLAQDTDSWMQQGLWPFAQVLTPEARIHGSMLNIIEGIRAGTTTFCDYDVPMTDLAANHWQAGTRARIAETINEMPPDLSNLAPGDLYPLDPAVGQKKLKKALATFSRWHGQGDNRTTCLFGPQGPDMLSRELLLEIQVLTQKHDTMMHMHVAQGDREIDQMRLRYGQRSIPWLDQQGLLNSRLLAVHLTEASPEETALVAARGAAMILCSGSIAIIDGIVPPAAEFLQAGGRLALGSDQAPGNNCNNMFNEMKLTALLNKCRARDPKVFPAWQVLRLATIEGARAIGLGDQIGSLAPGKKADIIIVDLNRPALSPQLDIPVRNIVPNLVYAANGSEVETSIIDGRVVMDRGKVLTVDEGEVIYKAQQAAREAMAKAKPGPGNVGTAMMKAGQL